MVKCLSQKRKAVSSDPQHHVKARQGGVSPAEEGQGKERQINCRSSQRAWLKKGGGGQSRRELNTDAELPCVFMCIRHAHVL